jgi:hypothetical protein
MGNVCWRRHFVIPLRIATAAQPAAANSTQSSRALATAAVTLLPPSSALLGGTEISNTIVPR